MLHKNKVKGLFLLVEFIVLICVFSAQAFAVVVINEVSPATSPEWVELYNTNPESVSLQGYIIDFGSDSQKKSFCDNDLISGNSYRAISLTASWLNNEGDTVTLKSGSDVVDSISYGAGAALQKPNNTQSITRSPDGSSNWILMDIPTQQGDAVSFECPTPTPTPTNTPTPTKTPTPIPTSKPANTPTRSASSGQASSPTPTIKQTIVSIKPTSNKNKSALPKSFSPSPNTSVLAVSDEEFSPTPKQDENSKGPSLFAWGKLFILMGVVIICSACGILIYKKYKQEKEEEI